MLKAVVSEAATTCVNSMSESLANRLRLGNLTEDGLSYKERFIVRSYEVGINKTATVETIANFLQSMPQEIIDTHELLNNHFGLYKGMSTTATATTADHDWRSFLHLLSLSSDRLEINHGRTEWRKKPAR